MKITKRQLRKIIREQMEIAVMEMGDEPEVYGHGGTARMTRAQLFDIATKAQSLHDQLGDDDELPEWVQGKVAVMADNMDTVADHLKYKIFRHETDQPVDV